MAVAPPEAVDGAGPVGPRKRPAGGCGSMATVRVTLVTAVTLPVVVWLAELIALQRSGDGRSSADLAAGRAILAEPMSLAMVFAGGFCDQDAVS